MNENFQKEISRREIELAAARASNNKRSEADILSRLGETYESYDYGQQAIDCYQQAVAIARELDDQQLQHHYLLKLGQTYDWMAQRQQAIDCFEQVTVLGHKMNEPGTELHCLILIGNIYERQHDYKNALRYLEAALKIYETHFPKMDALVQKRILDLRHKLDSDDSI